MSRRVGFLIAFLLAVGWLFVPALARAEMQLGANAMLVLPQADADDYAGTSPGVRAAYLMWFHPMVGLSAAITYVFVDEAELAEGTDVEFYTAEVGVRARGLPRTARPFAELLLGRHTARVDAGAIEDSESDLGFRIGGGLELDLGGGLLGVAQVSYAGVEINDADIELVTIEAGLSFRL